MFSIGFDIGSLKRVFWRKEFGGIEREGKSFEIWIWEGFWYYYYFFVIF